VTNLHIDAPMLSRCNFLYGMQINWFTSSARQHNVHPNRDVLLQLGKTP